MQLFSKEWIRRLLTKRRIRDSEDRKTREVRVQEELPNEKLVLLVQFTMVAMVILSAIEIVNIIVLKVWNAEVFAAITGLTGTITGVIIGKKA
jgi:hypothetical protein